NMGDCPQSCRWKYHLVEEKRPGEYHPVEYTAEGAYLFNSKDMCTLTIIPQLVEAGIDSFKIEGRMKSLYYLAVTVSSYKKALTSYLNNKEEYNLDENLLRDIESFSHRPYFPGFYLGKDADSESHFGSINSRTKDLIAKIDEKEDEYATITIKNKIIVGEELEIFSRNNYPVKSFVVTEIIDTKDASIKEVAQPNDIVKLKVDIPFEVNDIIRKDYEQ
ncbi:MAG: U32 family peptidase C-terminal domain-containing protein, partial [Nitrospinae bacterium]|nr:U32 family peptidase C-terminal domain-containing protein [Nitrospinota bacterium]